MRSGMDRDLRVSGRGAAAISGRLTLCAMAAALACLVAVAPVPAAPPDRPAPGAYTVNGPVRAIAHAGGRTFIGGDFTRVGRRTGSGAVLSDAGARRDFPEVAGGDVHASISDQAGGWYIGGTFTSVGGQPHARLAHVNADGTVDGGFNPRVTDFFGGPAEVNALALSRPGPGGARTLYVGGEFDLIGVGDTEPHRNVAALNASDGTPQAFTLGTGCAQTQLPACSPAVHSLALTYVPLPVTGTTPDPDQPLLFVGGSFTRIGSGSTDAMSETEGLAAVWAIGSVDGSGKSNSGKFPEQPFGGGPWKPEVTERTPGASVYTLQLGPVSFPSPTTMALVVYAGGSTWNTLDSSRTPLVRAYQFKISDTSARTVTSAQTFANWKPKPAGCVECAVRAMSLSGSTLHFGGEFTQVGDPTAVPAAYLAKIAAVPDPNDTASPAQTASPPALALDGPVRSLAASATVPGTLLAGGDFAGGMIAFDATSGVRSPPDWTSPDPDASVRTVAADSSTSSLYAGGAFRSLASVPRRGLAAFDGSGQLLDWAPAAGPTTGPPGVDALAARDNVVYVGGHFDGGLVALDATSGVPNGAFLSRPAKAVGRPSVLTLALLDSTLYAGGIFDEIGGQSRKNLAALDTGSGAAFPAWRADVRGPYVRAILPACGAVYVGGDFDEIAGQDRRNLAAVDTATGAPTAWSPRAGGAVLALARQGPDIYVGGRFAQVGGAERQKLAAVDASTGIARESFNAGVDAATVGTEIRGLAVSNSALYVGGVFAPLGTSNPTHSNLAAVDLGSGKPTRWSAAVDGPVETVSVADDALYAGGSFGSIGAAAQRGLAVFGPDVGSSGGVASCVRQNSNAVTEGPGGSTAPQAPTGVLPRPRVAPAVIAGTAVTVARLRSGGRALVVRFRLARAGVVHLRFARRDRGGRFVAWAGATVRGRRGPNTVSFPGLRVGRRVFGLGRYRLRATVPASRGVEAASQTASFTIRPAPAIAGTTVNIARLRSGSRGLVVRFWLGRPAAVRLQFEQDRRGRFVRRAGVTASGRHGLNTVSFLALRVGRRVLGPGRYRLRVTVPASRGLRAAEQTASFTVTLGGSAPAR